jgi:hypothetical protein
MNEIEHCGYAGPERRHRQVYVTRNSEYHCRDGVCIAVRSKRTGEFEPGHAAIGRRMTAGLRFNDLGAVTSASKPGSARVGDQLCFSLVDDRESCTEVVTSPLRAIERPPRDVVQACPN